MDSVLSSPFFEQVLDVLLKIAGALAIVLAGVWLSGRTERRLLRVMGRSAHIDAMLAAFFASLARIGVIVVALVAAFEVAGIGWASIIALLGAAGLAVGLALQGTLNHVASGVMLLVFRPFKVGDFIEAGGVSGTVKAVTLFATELATPDNVMVIVPNGAVWSGVVRNYAVYGTRRLDLEFRIGYEDDIDKAANLIELAVRSDSRAHAQPAPAVTLARLADTSAHLAVQVWCDTQDYGGLRSDLMKAVKDALDREGIRPPGPQSAARGRGTAPEPAA